MRSRILAAVLLALPLLPLPAAADLRSDARRLLAHRVREIGVDPARIVISGVAVVQQTSLLSWDAGKQSGVIGLVRYADRWWDAYDSVAAPGASCREETVAFPLTDAPRQTGTVPVCPRVRAKTPPFPVLAGGGIVDPQRAAMQGYGFTMRYAPNDAAPGVTFTQVYGRAPTPGEFLANPPPPKDWGGPDSIFLYDLTIGGSAAVHFAAGSTLDVWCPFVLDDGLQYHLSYFAMGKLSPRITATIFDNVLHFDLPAFTLAPGDQLMGEIDGYW